MGEAAQTKINTIGIDDNLNRPRIKKLLTIGVFASLIMVAADFMLGWTPAVSAGNALESLFATALLLPRWSLIAGTVLGLLFLPIEALAYFGVYRLVADKALDQAHTIRTGIIGYAAFGPCTHVLTGLSLIAYKTVYTTDPSAAFQVASDIFYIGLIPASVLMLLMCLPMVVAQAKAFSKGLTPYPRYAAVFNLAVGFVIFSIIGVITSGFAFGNAIGTASVSLGNLFTFVGLLVTLPETLE